MFNRTSVIGAALLAVSICAPRLAAAQDPMEMMPGEPIAGLSAMPRAAQPSGLLHVSVKTDTARFRPAFFDVFVEEARFRPAFFDVFVEVRSLGGFDTHRTQLELVGSARMANSWELLVQLPTEKLRLGAGGIVIVLDGKVVATTPVLLLPAKSPVQHVLGSGQAIDSFFDIFTELSFDGSPAGIDSFFDIFTELSLDGGQRVVDSFFDIFTEISLERRSPRELRKLRALRRLLVEMLRQSIEREKRAVDGLYTDHPRHAGALRILRALANEQAEALQGALSSRR